jgi:hypothetical protein
MPDRVLHRSRALTLLSIATIGVGIGASTILFALVSGIVLRPLPYDHPSNSFRSSTPTHGWASASAIPSWRATRIDPAVILPQG